MDANEIQAELQSQGVTDVKHIYQTRNGEKKKTATLILTFGTPNLPISIKAGYLSLKVEKHIPNPLRCFKCQKYGHHVSTCKHEAVCGKCGSAEHDATPCSTSPKCVNCGGDHPAFYNTCPIWVEEKEICKVKVTQNIPYPEARKIVSAGKTNVSNGSFAKIVKAKADTVETSTQTDITLVNCSCQTSISESLGNNHKSTQSSQTTVQKNIPSTSSFIKGGPTGPGRNLSLSPKRGLRTTSNPASQTGRPFKDDGNPVKTFNKYSILDGDEDPVQNPPHKFPGKNTSKPVRLK